MSRKRAKWGSMIIDDPVGFTNTKVLSLGRNERKKIIGNPYISQKFGVTDKPIDDCSRFRHTIFFAQLFNGGHSSPWRRHSLKELFL